MIMEIARLIRNEFPALISGLAASKTHDAAAIHPVGAGHSASMHPAS